MNANRRPVDFKILRRMIQPREVLTLLRIPYQTDARGVTRAVCPIHGAHSRRSRSFWCNREVWYCTHDRISGDALALYQRLTGLPLLDAAYRLCEGLRVAIPYLNR